MWQDRVGTQPTRALPFHFSGIFSCIFGVFSALELPPLSAIASEISAMLRPVDHHHRIHPAAYYRLRSSSGTSVAALATRGDLLFAISHCLCHCSSDFPTLARPIPRSYGQHFEIKPHHHYSHVHSWHFHLFRRHFRPFSTVSCLLIARLHRSHPPPCSSLPGLSIATGDEPSLPPSPGQCFLATSMPSDLSGQISNFVPHLVHIHLPQSLV